MPDRLINALNLPFQEQIDFFRAKLNLPTERWDDIWKGAHDRAFVVAGAMKADLLDDLRKAVSPLQRTTLEQFRKDFNAIVAKRGWHGWTGEGTKGGEAWRTKVIYETNVRTSHAAGRYKQLTDPDTLKAMPYWRYVHNDSVMHPREEHKKWGDMRLTLRHDDAFWKTHFPPNGWGCRCRVVAVRGPETGDSTRPPAGWDEIDSKTGEQVGIDKGWGYAPGAMADEPLRNLVQQKLIKLPEAIGKALSHEIHKYVVANADPAAFARLALAEKQAKPALWLGFVAERISKVISTDLSDYLVLLPADAVRHVDGEHGGDSRTQRAPAPEDYADAGRWLRDGEVELSDPGPDGKTRIKSNYRSGGEDIQSIWEVRPGKKNRALALVSMWVKR